MCAHILTNVLKKEGKEGNPTVSFLAVERGHFQWHVVISVMESCVSLSDGSLFQGKGIWQHHVRQLRC